MISQLGLFNVPIDGLMSLQSYQRMYERYQ